MILLDSEAKATLYLTLDADASLKFPNRVSFHVFYNVSCSPIPEKNETSAIDGVNILT